MLNITSDHIYHRIARALNTKTPSRPMPYTFEDVESACEKLHDIGLNVTTYADASMVARVIIGLELL
jgi:hypothetical protein